MTKPITVGALALQGAFQEHLRLLRQAANLVGPDNDSRWKFIEVRTPGELSQCDALIIPGGESTTMSLVAARSNLLEPLREFVKHVYTPPATTGKQMLMIQYRIHRRPTWGTCAGLILLAESANRTKKGGQDLVGGLDIRVNRNHFGRQVESFEANLDLPFLATVDDGRLGMENAPFKAIFIRAPVVEKILPTVAGEQAVEAALEETVIAPSRAPVDDTAKGVTGQDVEIMATLPGRSAAIANRVASSYAEDEVGDIIAVRQGNCFGTSFHPELTGDARIHVWWLEQVKKAVENRKEVVDTAR